MPCAFKAVSSAPMSLEIQWWYLKEDGPKELPHELQINAPTNRAKEGSREATKISTVRVQGNAISHRLSLSKVKKEDEGVYECRVSDLWAEENQEFTVHATLHIIPGGGMVAEEAVSHIQNRLSLRNTNTALGGGSAGSATLKPGQGLVGGVSSEQGKRRVPQMTQPNPLTSITSTTTTSMAKSSASPLPGTATILRQQHRADCSIMSMMDHFLYITLLFLHKLLPLMLAH
ncbi:V-set and transmembrane domain-containing protein 2B [Leuresthes tenuis]|uniref:V-set and transmembrane domain-containing protein 2B n=1 Tax=Leuresthes tenuis TaxID=355514 RepID=UPI003B509B99